MNRRGSVILHVLVTGVIVALIAAFMLRVSLMNYLQTARANNETWQKRGDEGALSRVVAYWSMYGACTNAPGYNCGSVGSAMAVGSCNCTCHPTNAAVDPVITSTTGSGTNCNVTVAGVDTAMPAPN